MSRSDAEKLKVELLKGKLKELKGVLEKIDIERVVKSIREDRESR